MANFVIEHQVMCRTTALMAYQKVLMAHHRDYVHVSKRWHNTEIMCMYQNDGTIQDVMAHLSMAYVALKPKMPKYHGKFAKCQFVTGC